MGLISFLFVLPLVWMISASFKPNAEVYTFPIQWIPKNPPGLQQIERVRCISLSW
ncbi:MAG: hypothetical protein PUD16_01260 [bacterium]|nr:hypothetical protein [bacterium]